MSIFGELFLDGTSDAGIPIGVATAKVNSYNPMPRDAAKLLCGWALDMLHTAYGFDLTSVGSVREQVRGELDRARLTVENTYGWIDEDTDPLGNSLRNDVYNAVVAGIVAYNKAAQAASDSSAVTARLVEDLKNIPHDAVALAAKLAHDIAASAANVVGETVGGLVFGNLTTMLLIGGVGYLAYLYVAKGGGGRAISNRLNRRLER